MKKLPLIVLVLFIAQGSFAQNFLSRMTFGLKAGGNYSNFTNANFETEGLAGFHVGGTLNFRLNEKFSIQQDILYSTQGAKLKSTTPFGGEKIELSYLSVPILIRYTTKVGFYIEAGPQANMLIRDADVTGFDDFADKADAGVAAGIGFCFKGGPVKGLGIGARYYQGFMDVGKFSSLTINKDFYNSVGQLSLFYTF